MQTNIRSFRLALMLTYEEYGDLIGKSASQVLYAEREVRPLNAPLPEFSEVSARHLIRLVKFQRLYKSMNLTQVDFAKLAGMQQRQVSVYLRFGRKLSQERFDKLLSVLGISEPVTTAKDIHEARKLFERIQDNEGWLLKTVLHERGVKNADFAARLGVTLPTLLAYFESNRFTDEVRARVEAGLSR